MEGRPRDDRVFFIAAVCIVIAGVYLVWPHLDHGLWQRRFGGQKDVLGKTIVIAAHVRTIVGVMPPGFWIVPWGRDIELWLGLNISGQPSNRMLVKIARLKPG